MENKKNYLNREAASRPGRDGLGDGYKMDKKLVAFELLKVATLLLGAEGDKCGPKGCIRKRTVERKNEKTGEMEKQERWGIISGQTGKWWPQTYKDKATAQKVLKKYHAGF
jgi:hypothetical protein